jgi:hypothetical protein
VHGTYAFEVLLNPQKETRMRGPEWIFVYEVFPQDDDNDDDEFDVTANVTTINEQ